ncbi:ABC transporter substrate-binding protein [Acidimangrovimonas sediminis]|uniref:ABC transporter substrate-binding protein n=1 Tax=Acidimangrovimonas sediminis TaxID=2056283 RepID=UPI001E2C8FE2|nr:ABC transporter substrate-binding protein [Acidimangrovimonas sediminis]
MVLRSTTDIKVLGPTIDDFVARNPGVAVDFQQWGSNDLYAATARDCDAGRPAADAVLSSAVQQMVELVNRACAQPYRSSLTASLPAARRWRDEIWGVTLEPAVIIYNTHLVPAADVPRTRFALLDLMRRSDRRYDGKIATYDIEASGLGYLFAFEDSLEASTFGSLIEGFSRAHAVATCCSAEIIKGVSDGTYKIAYNVLGSYVNARRDPGVGVVLPLDYTLVLSRGYMIPRGAGHAAWAERLVDFLLSPAGQQDLSRAGLVMVSRTDEGTPPESVLRPIAITPVLLVALDAQKRAQFIRRWRDVFGR